MSPTGHHRTGVAGLASQLPLMLGLVLVWMLLWGEFTWLTFLSGVVLSSVVSVLFFLPAVQLGDRFNPWWALVTVVRLVWDIARASVSVGKVALMPHYVPSNAIIALHLRTRNDLILTLTAVSLSIVPGSIVVDVNRMNSTLYLHVFNVNSLDEIEQLKKASLATEARIVRAIGSKEDMQRLSAVMAREAAAEATAGEGEAP